jgi:hypothetical protein
MIMVKEYMLGGIKGIPRYPNLAHQLVTSLSTEVNSIDTPKCQKNTETVTRKKVMLTRENLSYISTKTPRERIRRDVMKGMTA